MLPVILPIKALPTSPPQGSWSNNGYPNQEWETFTQLSSFWLICSWHSSSTHNIKPLSFIFYQGLMIKFVPVDIRSMTVFILRNSVAYHIVLKRPSVCVLKDETWNRYSLISFQGSGLHLAHFYCCTCFPSCNRLMFSYSLVMMLHPQFSSVGICFSVKLWWINVNKRSTLG